jgi:hypothetical protein
MSEYFNPYQEWNGSRENPKKLRPKPMSLKVMPYDIDAWQREIDSKKDDIRREHRQEVIVRNQDELHSRWAFNYYQTALCCLVLATFSCALCHLFAWWVGAPTEHLVSGELFLVIPLLVMSIWDRI